MLALLSPAKSLDFESPLTTQQFSQPDFLEHSSALIDVVRQCSPADLSNLMKISDALGVLNYDRFQQWQPPFSLDNARQAVLAFDGDVYQGLAAAQWSGADFDFAQQHLGILSGLYGLLKPLDLIQPYRLEMGTKLGNPRGKDLYQFWGDLLTEAVNARLQEESIPVVINLASQEYFKAIAPKRLRARVIEPVFKDEKNGQYKIISFYAKRARGLMAAYLVQQRLQDPESLKQFTVAGYRFDPQQSSTDKWVFIRPASVLEQASA